MESNKKMILVVDDEPDILEFVQAMLEDAGYTVTTTEKSDYLEGLGSSSLPDLILLDMLLTGMDGREIVQKLKSQESTKHIPIIMSSAHPIAEKEAEASGADDYLAKPFEMDELLALVARYL